MTFAQPNVLPILDPKTDKVDADQLYQLQEDYTVKVYVKTRSYPYTHNIKITVPKGYVTDLATIPRWAWTISGLTPDGLYRGAATVHDYIYGKHVKGTNYSYLPSGEALTRADCDLILLQLMKQSGDNSWHPFAIYHAVRLFGWMYF